MQFQFKLKSATPLKLTIHGALLSLGFAAMAAPCTAFAADKAGKSPQVETLEEVEVSATSTKEPKATEGYVGKRSTTATKTDTLLRDVPQSISVATQELMKDQAVQNLGDVVRYTPGVGAAQGEGNRETFIFRGQQTTGDFFVDGMRDDTQYYRDLYNIDRVEVLKGPNGMIFGRGGAGGVINRVSKEAGWDPIRELTLQLGSYDQARTTIDIGQGMNEVAAFRLNAMFEDGNSYRDGVGLKRQGINPTITLKPSDSSKIVLGAEYFKDERIADRGIPSFNGRPFRTNESTFFGNASKSPTDTEVQAYSALIEHAFDNGVTLRNRTRYADYDKFYQNIFPGAVNAAGTTVSISAYNNATQRQNLFNQTDLLYTLNTGSVQHQLLAGMELGRQETDNFRNTGFFTAVGPNATSDFVSARSPTYTGPVTFRQKASDANNHVENTITAFYLQDQIKFTPKFQAVVGLRHDEFETDFRNDRIAAGVAGHKINTDDNLLSPRLGLIYKPVVPVSIYTSYSLSYVPRAGDQLASLTLTNKAFDPEKFKNLEVGAKWDINPDLAFTGAVYKLERSNVAVPDPINPATTILVDGQETKGLEVGVNGKITSAWSVVGGYAYQHAEITKAQSASIPAGSVVAQVPKSTFSLWNRYDFNETWGAALGLISRTDMYAASDNAVTLPGYTRVDGAIYAKIDKNLRLQLNVENLLNKEYFLYAHSNNNITPGSPTAARLTLIANF